MDVSVAEDNQKGVVFQVGVEAYGLHSTAARDELFYVI
jgi:hypothetical protein